MNGPFFWFVLTFFCTSTKRMRVFAKMFSFQLKWRVQADKMQNLSTFHFIPSKKSVHCALCTLETNLGKSCGPYNHMISHYYMCHICHLFCESFEDIKLHLEEQHNKNYFNGYITVMHLLITNYFLLNFYPYITKIMKVCILIRCIIIRKKGNHKRL